MLSIQCEDVYEEVRIGDLFQELDFNSELEPNSDDFDTLQSCDFGIEVLSLDDYYPIEGIRWTKNEELYRLRVKGSQGDIFTLDCADKHIVMQQNPAEWVYVSSLLEGSQIVCDGSVGTVLSIEKLSLSERLCDLQVRMAHSYYANNILSHNSHFLVQIGAHALRVGKNVVHYTFELTETAVGIRYDSNLTGINSSEIQDSKQEVLDTYSKMDLGRLIIKEYPTGSCTVGTIRNHLEKLALKGLVPNVLIIDYADIMRSTREYDALRMELKLIYEELRNLAMERGIPIWTASQANRESSSSDIVGLENMSESYGKAMVADVVLSLSRKPTEKATGAGRLFIAKNRAGRDGILFPVHIDTARSKITVLDENSLTLQETMSQDNSDRKKHLKEKWEELMREKK